VIERYSGIFQGDEIRVTRRFTDFPPADAIHPNDGRSSRLGALLNWRYWRIGTAWLGAATVTANIDARDEVCPWSCFNSRKPPRPQSARTGSVGPPRPLL
jgi:hypothetical protein